MTTPPFSGLSEVIQLARKSGGGCSLAKPVSNANNREFLEN
jgi:hypothetical protein